jgi:hypothetical protein
MPNETGDIISVLFPLLYLSLIYGLPSCLLVAGLGALVKPRRFGDSFRRIFTWSIAGASIAAGGFSLVLLTIVFIVKNPAYRGQGLGIAINGPIIFAPLGAIIGGSLRFILPNVSR